MCANCKLFDWDQPESGTLMQCSRCKVVLYCSVDCQKEHYQVVHKKHCKKLAAMMTHDPSNPLLKEALVEDTSDSLMKISQRILAKMRDDCHPAFATMPQCGYLIELEEMLTNGRKSIWGLRLHS